MTNVYYTGIAGEEAALLYLKRKGFKLLEKRYRDGRGEIDLVMKDKKTYVFVEVKCRKDGEKGSGLTAVTRDKQSRLRNAASWYAVRNNLTDAPMRFDVVEITLAGITHIENAF